MDLDSIRIKLLDESAIKDQQLKEFNVSSADNSFEMTVRFVLCPGWPHQQQSDVEGGGDGGFYRAVELVRAAQVIHRDGSNGPLTVVDRFGGTEAATFAALFTLLRHLDYENCVDVYQTAKSIHWRRPGVWKRQEDLMRLYKVLESYHAATAQRDSVEQLQQQQ